MNTLLMRVQGEKRLHERAWRAVGPKRNPCPHAPVPAQLCLKDGFGASTNAGKTLRTHLRERRKGRSTVAWGRPFFPSDRAHIASVGGLLAVIRAV